MQQMAIWGEIFIFLTKICFVGHLSVKQKYHQHRFFYFLSFLSKKSLLDSINFLLNTNVLQGFLVLILVFTEKQHLDFFTLFSVSL